MWLDRCAPRGLSFQGRLRPCDSSTQPTRQNPSLRMVEGQRAGLWGMLAVPVGEAGALWLLQLLLENQTKSRDLSS